MDIKCIRATCIPELNLENLFNRCQNVFKRYNVKTPSSLCRTVNSTHTLQLSSDLFSKGSSCKQVSKYIIIFVKLMSLRDNTSTVLASENRIFKVQASLKKRQDIDTLYSIKISF